MKFFIDTADVDEIRAAGELGLVDGVTTNPSLVAKSGRDFHEVLEEIISLVDGPISAEVVATDAEGMLREAAELAALAPEKIVIKGPMTDEGLKATKALSDQGIKNVFAYEARSEEGGYVCGVLAAKLSESNVYGVIGPIETGDAKLYVDGFRAGVLATKPDAQVNVNWTGSFSDVALASEAAQTHINVGADVLTGTAQMVVGAIGVARQRGVLWFGTQADQTSLAPEVVVANQVYDWTVVLKPMIQLIKEGTMGGTTYALTLANGGLKIVVNQEALVGKTIQDIIEGKIDIKL